MFNNIIDAKKKNNKINRRVGSERQNPLKIMSLICVLRCRVKCGVQKRWRKKSSLEREEESESLSFFISIMKV